MLGLGLGLVAASTLYNIYASGEAASDSRAASAAQAKTQKLRSYLKAGDIYEEGAETIGSITAITGASGLEITGSPYLALREVAREVQEDADRVVKFGAQEAEFISQSGRAQSNAIKRQNFANVLGGATTAFSLTQRYYNSTKASGTGKDV